MELILLAASTVAGGAGLASAYWRSAHGACVCIGLAAAAVAVLTAMHDAFTAAAVLLVQAAVGLAVLPLAVPADASPGRPRRVLPAVVVLGLGTILAMALTAGVATGPFPPAYPPRSGTLVFALGGLFLLSAVVGISALSRRAPAGPAPGEAS